jgi:hypothetical protein
LEITVKPHRLLVYTLVPLLALGGYIAADLMAPSATPDEPRANRLIAQQDCNLNIGTCILQHENLVVHLSGEKPDHGERGIRLRLVAPESLSGVAIDIAMRDEGDASLPENMLSDDTGRQWTIMLDDVNHQGILRLLLSTQGASYFAELPITL